MKLIKNKTNKKKLKTIQNDISNEELIKKINTTANTVQNIQRTLADKETMRKLSDDNKKYINEIIEKIDTIQLSLNNIQNNIADKETMRKLCEGNKKSVVMSYLGLSIAYLGIGLTVLLSSLKLIAIQYGIIFSFFFGGSIILAYLAYVRKKE
jgi:hypothetical protein